MKNEDFIGTKWNQHCGDTIVILKKSPKAGMWYGEFIKYPFIKEFRKDVILRGEALNPRIEIEEFKNKIWLQNCGDSLKILRKTKIYKNKEYLWECEFQKYPYKILCTKGNIKRGTIINPEIERIEFINKIWPQNCGDSLRIIEKTDKKLGSAALFKCQFIKEPNIIYKTKVEIKEGRCYNSLLNEIKIGNVYKQNCGDSLKVIEKVNTKKNVYKCEFLKYKNIVLREKYQILKGSCLNPQIEKVEFINKIWIQKEEEPLKVINKVKNKNGYWNCIFLNTKNKIQACKKSIIKGEVVNPLHRYVSLGEKELENFILSIFKGDIIFENWEILSNYELDIYIPSLRIAFEFNGIYWHSNKFKNEYYHLNKLKLCNSKNIALYYIWEDEWRDKQDEIKIWLKELILNNRNISKDKDKMGWYKKDMIPKLIKRDKFYCWSF